MNITKASTKDLEAIIALNSLVMSNNPKWDPDAIENFAETPKGKEYFKEELENGAGIFLIAKNTEEKLIGYINGAPMPCDYRKSKYFEIHNLGVIESERKKGLGMKLMEELTQRAKEQGFEKIYLICYAKNKSAIDFYKALGYKEIDICLEKEI